MYLITNTPQTICFVQHMFKLCIERFKYGQYQGSPMLCQTMTSKRVCVAEGTENWYTSDLTLLVVKYHAIDKL